MYHTYRVPAKLSAGIPVEILDKIWITEHLLGHLEGDAVVLAIFPRLGAVPTEVSHGRMVQESGGKAKEKDWGLVAFVLVGLGGDSGLAGTKATSRGSLGLGPTLDTQARRPSGPRRPVWSPGRPRGRDRLLLLPRCRSSVDDRDARQAQDRRQRKNWLYMDDLRPSFYGVHHDCRSCTMANTDELINIEENPELLRCVALKAVADALGQVGFVRFVHQTDRGSGDFTKEKYERPTKFDNMSFEEIYEYVLAMRERRKAESALFPMPPPWNPGGAEGDES